VSGGIYPAFVVDALSFLISAFFIYRVSYAAPAPSAVGGGVGAAIQQYVEGLRYLRQHVDVLMVTLLKSATGLVVSGAFQVVQVRLSESVFVIGEGGATGLGLIYAVVGVGTGIGPIFGRWLTGDRDRPLRWAIAVAFGLAALGLLIIAPLGGFGWVLFGSLLRGVGAGIVWVFSTQLLLQLTHGPVRGRVFSSDFAGQTLTNAIGAGVAGWALDGTQLGVTGLLVVLGVLTLVFGAAWAAWITVGRARVAAPEAS
jgi:hypothetical protein